MIRPTPAARGLAACALLVAVAALVPPARAQRAPNTLFRRAPAPDGSGTFLLPDGWVAERDSAAGVALRVRTADGRVALLRYEDRGEPLGGGPAPAARRLLGDALARAAHPQARNLRVADARPLPEAAREWERRLAAARAGAGVGCEAAVVTVEYQEGEELRREVLCGIVESGPERWEARALFAASAPAAEFAAWEPLLGYVLRSLRPAEAHGADLSVAALGLAVPGESLWENPLTGGLDAGSFHFGRYRWVTPAGDEIWSFNETFTPNAARLLGRDDWQKSLPH